MLNGTCHCGEVQWTLDTSPKTVTACNCTICRRYGALWAYGYIDYDIQTTGQAMAYQRRDGGDICFYFCSSCGCVTHYVASPKDECGHNRAAVNVRMSDPSQVSELPIRHFEGHSSFKELPSDARKVRDMWF